MSKVTGDRPPVVTGGVASNGLMQALKDASKKAAEDHEKEVRDKLIEYHGDIYSGAAAYDNGVILAGYVAFFALWSGVTIDVSALCRLATVAFMGVSLMLYMSWHILQMVTRQRYEFKFADAFNYSNDAVRFNREWNEIAQQQNIATARLMRFWPWIFIPCVALGFLGGALLTYNALALTLGWPQLGK